jgi:hypothetical protein
LKKRMKGKMKTKMNKSSEFENDLIQFKNDLIQKRFNSKMT